MQWSEHAAGLLFFSRRREGSAAVVLVGFGKRRVTFSFLLNSLHTLHSRGFACRWFGRFFLGKREVQLQQWLQLFLGERKSRPFSLLIFRAPINVLGCLGTGPRLFLPFFLVILGWFLFQFYFMIGYSNTNFLLGFTVSLSIKKLATKNYVAADLEINNQKLYQCRFRNWQRNCATANSEIGN